MNKLFLTFSLLAVSAHASVINGDFEAGNSNWTEASVHIQPPQIICTVPNCGDGGGVAGPHSGDWWAFFGATPPDEVNPVPEDASITQNVAFPTGISYVTFFLWIGNRVGTEADYVRLYINGLQVFEATAATPGFDSYQRVTVPVPLEFTGAAYDLAFVFHSSVGAEAQVMNIDDVSLTTPEPSTFALAGLGLLYCVRKVRRRI